MIIYKITNLITGKVYIGQTIMPLARRWSQHKAAKRKSPLYSSIKKHGISNFIIEEIARASSIEELDILEIENIVKYNCIYPKGYNLAKGGNIGTSTRGLPPWNKNKKASDEALKNQSKSHIGQQAWNKGLKTPLETRLKQSAAKIGKHTNSATEFKKDQPSVFKGKRHTPESLALISANGNRRQILCVETGQIWASIKVAASDLKIAKSYFRRLVLSETKHKKTGLTFKFC